MQAVRSDLLVLPVHDLLHHRATVACATANTRSAPPGAPRRDRSAAGPPPVQPRHRDHLVHGHHCLYAALFLPGTYAPCPTCQGARYNAETLEVTYRGKNIAELLALSVDAAATFLSAVPAASRSLETLREVGLGYLRLGQPATELSGGEAQRIKLATELQRARRGHALYLLDEPTAGLHPSDVALLLRQLHRLVDAGNTVVLVEHDLDTIATADWVIDLGPGGGDAGGRVVAAGPRPRWRGPAAAPPRPISRPG